MSELLQTILGIVTGIITTIVIFVARVVWENWTRPYLQKIRYQGVIIEGDWKGESPVSTAEKNNGIAKFHLSINQSAHTINGEFEFSVENKSESSSMRFHVNGKLWEGYVIINLTPLDKRKTSCATSLLKIQAGGGVLSGALLFRNVFDGNVENNNIELSRAN